MNNLCSYLGFTRNTGNTISLIRENLDDMTTVLFQNYSFNLIMYAIAYIVKNARRVVVMIDLRIERKMNQRHTVVLITLIYSHKRATATFNI